MRMSVRTAPHHIIRWYGCVRCAWPIAAAMPPVLHPDHRRLLVPICIHLVGVTCTVRAVLHPIIYGSTYETRGACS